MSQTTSPEEQTEGTLNGLMLMVAVVSAVSGLLYGYDTGIISGALLQISDEFDTGHGIEQAIAAGILLGAVIGALVCSFLSERYGRHRTILLICTIFVVGSLACSVAPSAVTLALARIVLGFAVGGATQTVPMYVAEMRPPRSGAGWCCASSSPSASVSSSPPSWVRARPCPGASRSARPPYRPC